MKIIPGQSSESTVKTGANASQQSARDRAISALIGTAPQVNQNSVQAEEMAAIKPSNTLQDAPESTIPEVQEASTEATPSAPVEPPKVEDPISKQYAILARKEKQLRAQIAAQKQQLQQERDALEKQKAELSRPTFDESKYISKDRLLLDTFGVLEENGLSYDELTNRAMTRQQLDPRVQRQLEQQAQEIKALRDAQDQANKSYQEQQQQQYKQALEQIRSETKQLVEVSPEFETIKETGSVDDVVELIEKEFKASGRLITVEEAARAVEDYLTEEAVKIAKLKKIQQKLNPVAQGQTQSPVANAAAAQKQPLKTLTNAVGSTRPLSAKERAVLAFKGEKF